jgi:hypothetical protein
MAALLTAAKIVEEALRQVGALSPLDSAADPSMFEITITRLDMLISELSATERFWWMVGASQTVTLQSGQTTYQLAALADPPIEFVTAAFLSHGGREDEIPLLRRSEYDQIHDKADKGHPGGVYIERRDRPTMYVHPVPQIAGYSLRLTGQRYAPDIAGEKGKIAHGFPAAWQRYIVLSLAIDIGSGPVAKVPDGELDRLERRARESRDRLMAFSNRENVSRPRVTRPWGI